MISQLKHQSEPGEFLGLLPHYVEAEYNLAASIQRCLTLYRQAMLRVCGKVASLFGKLMSKLLAMVPAYVVPSRIRCVQMKFRLSKLSAIFAIGIGIGAAQVVHACAIPSQLILQQQLLNFKYENATHVLGATWTMQQAGRLDMPDPKRIVARGEERIALEEAERRAALRAVSLLQVELARKDIQKSHAISIVLVERMHRQPLLTAGRRSLDAFSAKDDMLFVTTDPALHAMIDGRLTLSDAVSAGVVRIYGADAERAAFLSDFSQIGSQPISASPVVHQTFKTDGGADVPNKWPTAALQAVSKSETHGDGF